MNYSTNLNLNKPERNEQYNLDDWNDNSDILASAITGLKNITDTTFKTALLNFCYPVGSLYWSSNSANPSTLFGGTWVQIKDKFVWAKGDSDTVGATGGAKTVTLTTANLPSHNHTLNSGNTSSSGTKTTAGFRGVASSDAGSASGWLDLRKSSYITGNGDGTIFGKNQTSGGTYDSMSVGYSGDSNLTRFTFTLPNHSHTSNGYLYGKTDTTGSGTAVDKMPPYVVKYCWERTA